MKLLILHLLITLFFSSLIIANDDSTTIRIQPQVERSPHPHSTDPAKHLACLNHLEGVATRLSMEIEDQTFSRSENPAIFWGHYHGVGGVFIVRPNAVTFNPVSAQINQFGVPVYPFSLTNQSNETLYMRLTVDENQERGTSGYRSTEDDPLHNYPLIGTQGSQITNNQAVAPIVSEALPAIQSMPRAIQSQINYQRRQSQLTEEWRENLMSDARQALCYCMNTEHHQLQDASLQVANQLSIPDIRSCGQPLVSRYLNWRLLLPFIITKANAAKTKDVKKTSHKQIYSLYFANQPQSLIGNRNIFIVKTAHRRYSYSITPIELKKVDKTKEIKQALPHKIKIFNKKYKAAINKNSVTIKKIK